MATTHEILKKLLERGLNQVDSKIVTAALYEVQRALPNVAVNDTAYTGPAAVDLAAIPSLQIVNSVGYNGGSAVIGGRTYRFKAYLPCTINGTSGGTIDWAGGTATISAFQASGINYTASALAMLKTTTLAGLTMNAAAAYTLSVVEGEFVASSSGSFGPRLATFVGGATAPIIGAGAWLELVELPIAESP